MTSQEETAAKKRGRPRKPAVPGEKKSIAFQVSAELYNYLVSVSEMAGHSISRVVEGHLEAQKDKIGRQSLDNVFIGKAHSVELLRHYALIFAAYDKQGNWQQDEAIRAGVLSAMYALNVRLMPLDSSKIGPGSDLTDPHVARLNEAWATGAKLGMLLAGPLVPADVAHVEDDPEKYA